MRPSHIHRGPYVHTCLFVSENAFDSVLVCVLSPFFFFFFLLDVTEWSRETILDRQWCNVVLCADWQLSPLEGRSSLDVNFLIISLMSPKNSLTACLNVGHWSFLWSRGVFSTHPKRKHTMTCAWRLRKCLFFLWLRSNAEVLVSWRQKCSHLCFFRWWTSSSRLFQDEFLWRMDQSKVLLHLKRLTLKLGQRGRRND